MPPDVKAAQAVRRGSHRVASASTTNMSVIEHVVVLIMENRSFDHMLGYLEAENPEIDGVPGDGAFANYYAGRGYPVP